MKEKGGYCVLPEKKKKMLEDITSTGQTGSVEGGKNFSNSQRKCNLT